MVRKTVSHYKIIKKLGSGGMGEVYRAEDTRLGRSVAIKFLPEKYSQDRLALERFKREARTASAVDHPNICTIYDVGEYEGRPFIVMQYVEGKTLRHAVRKAPLDVDEILDLATQVAMGLEKAHAQGIIHRDIKPGNIILTEDGLAKILDFGLAKLSAEQQPGPEDQRTTPGSAVGTTLYMSPEQVRGEELTPRSDLFSLGVMLYEMSTGKLPFTGPPKGKVTSGAVFDEILHKDPVPPVRINPEIPDDLEHIIQKCLEKDPDLRYQSVRELLADLKRMRRDSDISLTPVKSAPAVSRKPVINWKIAAAAGALAIVVVGLWYSGVFRPRPTGTSVGVVPFQNSSETSGQEALADGLTEDVVANLSKISGLSVYRFKGIDKSPQQKAAELGVANLLEGEIRRAGDTIRISSRLVEAQSGRVLWSENYDRELTDVFALQTEIALEVAEALQVELLPEEKSEVKESPTDSIEAYDLYLQGRFLRHTQENPEGLRQAVHYFRLAIEKDPEYALAYAGLAECYFMLASIYGAEPWEKFGEAAKMAVRYGEALPEPHVAMGLWQDFRQDDEKAADEEFRRALEIDPRHSNARREYARFLMRRGRFDRALEEIESVHDPMFAVTVHLTRAEIYRYQGHYDKSMREAHRFSEIWSGSDEPLLQMVWCYIALVDYRKAERMAERISSEHPAKYRLLAIIYMLQNRIEEAREISWKLVLLQPDTPFTWWLAGQLALLSNELQEAKDNFEKARELKSRDDLNWWRPYATYLGVTLWRLGQRRSAEELFSERIQIDQSAIEEGNQNPELPKDLAVIHATQGDNEAALQWMQRAYDSGYAWYDWLRMEGLLKGLDEDPRFQQIVTEIKQNVEQMRLRVEAMEMEWAQTAGGS